MNIDHNKRKSIVRICLYYIIGAVLFLALILPARGMLNVLNRSDYIIQRLDDYPGMYENFRVEAEEWWNWKQTDDYEKRAELAALIYTSDEKHEGEKEKLSYITDILGVERAVVISSGNYQKYADKNSADSLNTYSAELPDGRLIAISLHGTQLEEGQSLTEDDTYFMGQLQAGLPGYAIVIHGDAINIYPHDENEEEIRSIIAGMMADGKLDPAELRKQAASSEAGNTSQIVLNRKAGNGSGKDYILFCSAYAGNEDIVIDMAERADLVRFGRKRSWALWWLCCGIMVPLGYCLWKTRLYIQGENPSPDRRSVSKKGRPVLYFAFVLMTLSVLMIQSLSSANLSQQGATDQAEYLKTMLQRESGRADRIIAEFDEMYTERAGAAATLLADNPQMMDLDSLYTLDKALGGSGLRVFDAAGKLLGSDDRLQRAVTEQDYESSSITGSVTDAEDENASLQDGDEGNQTTRYYRAAMVNENGRAIGWTELEIPQKRLDELLADTSLRDLINDLNILDTMHVVVVDPGEERKIIASTRENWIGNPSEKMGLHPELLFDGYEGIANFQGSKCYSVVFSHNDDLVVVGSENESTGIALAGLMILLIPLLLILTFVIHRPLVRVISSYQKSRVLADPDDAEYQMLKEYPPIWEYFRQFMAAVFFLSAVLFIVTRGNTEGLTYNILRGTWSRGFNIATITSSIMLMSMVFAIRYLLEIILLGLGNYLSPRGRTIYLLIQSSVAYIGFVVIIIYTLSMCGVNTATLVGGVGVVALIFSIGANSLIGDVMAGAFMIFEGDIMVGDTVVIGDFRGTVIDIGMRTTKLRDNITRDVMTINNSRIVELTNQSREISNVMIDIPVDKSISVETAERLIKEELISLPEKLPEIIGTPKYLGVSKMPEKNSATDELGGYEVRISCDFLEKDREHLTYQVYRELFSTFDKLNTNSEDEIPE